MQAKKDTPVAIIQNGTRKDEKVGIGTVETIIDEVHAKQLSSPAIIIIGDVVKESVQLKSFYQNFTEVHKENIKPHPTIIKKTQYPTY